MDWLAVHIYRLIPYGDHITLQYEYICTIHPEWRGFSRQSLYDHTLLQFHPQANTPVYGLADEVYTKEIAARDKLCGFSERVIMGV